MKVKTMKKTLSVLCASAMVVGTFAVAGMGTVEAAVTETPSSPSPNWTWNAEVTKSGWLKVPFKEFTVTAESEYIGTGESKSEAIPNDSQAIKGTGHAKKLNDGNLMSYYHSDYTNNQQQGNGSILNAKNTITVTLNKAQSVKGITYTPRQDDHGNGAFTKLKVEVKTDAASAYTEAGIYAISYEGDYRIDQGSAYWNAVAPSKNEHELVFAAPQDNVKEIKITVLNSSGGRANQFLSGAELSVLKNKNSVPQANTDGSYNVADIALPSGQRVAPTAPENKLFEGWYSEKECLTHLPKDTTAEKAYAKFIDASVLDVKTQVPVSADCTKDTTLRFVSSLNTNKYKEAGFYVTKDGVTKKFPASAVFNQLKVMGTDGADETLTPQNSFSQTDSKLFLALNFSPVGANLQTKDFTAQAYFVTQDGIEVKGKAVTRNVAQNVGAFYMSKLNAEADKPNEHLTVNNPGWVAFSEIQNSLAGNKGNWEVSPANNVKDYNNFLFGNKLQTKADGTAKWIEHTFQGSGIVLFAQKCPGAGEADILIDDVKKCRVSFVSPVEGQNLNNQCMFYITGLDPNAQHKLKITRVSAQQVNFEAAYIIDKK